MVERELVEGIKGVGEIAAKGAKRTFGISKKALGIGLSKRTKLIVIFVLIALLIGCYFLFLFRQSCDTQECFLESLWKCKRVDYTSLTNDTWHYSILGQTLTDCKVEVVAVKIGSQPDLAKYFEGKQMTCYIPKATVFMPESKIEYCHGLLKEEIQDQVIRKMHLYIVENIGEIQEIPKVV